MKCSWLAGGLALVGSIGLACTPQPPPKPDLLLVTFDTTRADAIGAWGATPSPSPTLDGLAAEGLRFDEAMATAPLTLPSHTSMLSGLYPDRHQVRDNGQPLPETLASIAEPLRDGGWSTGAFVAAVVLDGGLESAERQKRTRYMIRFPIISRRRRKKQMDECNGMRRRLDQRRTRMFSG